MQLFDRGRSPRSPFRAVTAAWCVPFLISVVSCGGPDEVDTGTSKAAAPSSSTVAPAAVTISAGATDVTEPGATDSTDGGAPSVAPTAAPSTDPPAAPSTDPPTKPTSGPAAAPGALDEALAWPMRQKLAQLMFTGFNSGPGAETDPAQAKALIDLGVGGLFVGRKEVNLFGSDALLDARKNAVPPLVATDGEGGQVDVLPEIMDVLPAAREMAAWDPSRIQEAASVRGTQLLERGIDVDFAPLLDVAGGASPLGDRTWSSDPQEVIRTAGAFAEGLCQSGVMPTFKHFPGHGRADAHGDDAPARTPPLEDMQQLDLVPFRQLLSSMGDRSLVMTGHLDVPGLTASGTPFSLDPNAMTLLRDDLGYDGVAVTDELAEMGAITQRGISVPDAVERALIAGNDMALYFGDAKQLGDVLDQLEEAVSVGRLSMERVDQSLARVITLKASGGCSV